MSTPPGGAPTTPPVPSAPPPKGTAHEASHTRSPLFEALNQPRYYRQGIIREVEALTGRRLLVYFANTAHANSSISTFDVTPFQDLLLDCSSGDEIDLLLQTGGGDIDAAEKLVLMARHRAQAFRVIVTERAKSAGTLIALAADSILMSSTSELGPIDPQITITQADGKTLTRPAQSYLDGLEQIKQDVNNNGGQINAAYFPLLQQLDPALLDYCVKSTERAQEFAEKWLQKHMLASDHPRAKIIAGRLGDVKQYRSHGMVIDADEAKAIGLTVQDENPDSELWRLLWKLHAAYDMLCRQSPVAKVMESRKVSLAF